MNVIHIIMEVLINFLGKNVRCSWRHVVGLIHIKKIGKSGQFFFKKACNYESKREKMV